MTRVVSTNADFLCVAEDLRQAVGWLRLAMPKTWDRLCQCLARPECWAYHVVRLAGRPGEVVVEVMPTMHLLSLIGAMRRRDSDEVSRSVLMAYERVGRGSVLPGNEMLIERRGL